MVDPRPQPTVTTPTPRVIGGRAGPWVALVAVTMLLFEVVDLAWIGVIAPTTALALAAVQRHRPPDAVCFVRRDVDRRDLVVIVVMYVEVVGLFRLAFRGFGTDRVAGLFLSFAAGLLLGVIGPVVYMVWRRGRSLRDLGIGGHHLQSAVLLGLVFAGIQVAMTLWAYDLPEPVDWVPLLVMSIVVGAFESVFFRGFIQGRLEASFGAGPAVAGAAALYAAYHVGYGMGTREMSFLFGLGVVYALAYRVVGNLVVLWPLLTPLGAFFNNLESGDIELPWASIAGFADVAALMIVVLLLGRRHVRRREASLGHTPSGSPPHASGDTRATA